MRTYRLIAEFMRNHVRFLVEFPVALNRSAHGIFIYYFLQSIESAVDMGLGSNFSFQCINFSFQNIKTLTHIVKSSFYHGGKIVESDWFLIVTIRNVFHTLYTIIPPLFLVKFNIELNGQRYRKKLESLRVVFIPHTYLTPHVSPWIHGAFSFCAETKALPG